MSLEKFYKHLDLLLPSRKTKPPAVGNIKRDAEWIRSAVTSKHEDMWHFRYIIYGLERIGYSVSITCVSVPYKLPQWVSAWSVEDIILTVCSIPGQDWEWWGHTAIGDCASKSAWCMHCNRNILKQNGSYEIWGNITNYRPLCRECYDFISRLDLGPIHAHIGDKYRLEANGPVFRRNEIVGAANTLCAAAQWAFNCLPRRCVLSAVNNYGISEGLWACDYKNEVRCISTMEDS